MKIGSFQIAKNKISGSFNIEYYNEMNEQFEENFENKRKNQINKNELLNKDNEQNSKD